MSTGILAIGHETILTDLSTSLYLFCLPEFFHLDIFLADPGLGAKVLGGVVPGEPKESGEAREQDEHLEHCLDLRTNHRGMTWVQLHFQFMSF